MCKSRFKTRREPSQIFMSEIMKQATTKLNKEPIAISDKANWELNSISDEPK